MIEITLKVESSTEKYYRLIELLSKNGYEFSAKPVLLKADVSGSSVPVVEQSIGTMFDENYIKQKRAICSHPDVGTDGSGDYCKRCGKRW